MAQLNISLPPPKDSPDFDGWLVQVTQYLRDYLGLYDSGTQVSFTQSGTGAVARTAQNKMRDVISVKDFGVTGNGTTDDTANFQIAVNAVNAAGGGTLFCPIGTYLFATKDVTLNHCILMKSNVCIKGDGRGTIFTTPSGFGNWDIFRTDNDTDDIAFENFCYNGNGTNNLAPATPAQTQGLLYLQKGNRLRVLNIYSSNVSGQRVFSIGGSFVASYYTDVLIDGCEFDTIADAVSGNTLQTDHSTIWINAQNVRIVNNTFNNPSLATVATAIENQGAIVTVGNNTIMNYNIGIIGAAIFDDHTAVSYTGNCMANVQSGYRFYCQNSKNFDADINGGSINQINEVHPIIDLNNFTTAARYVSVQNVMLFNTKVSPTGNDAFGIAVGRVGNLVIQNNKLYATAAQGVAIGSNGVDTNSTRMTISGNSFYNCGRTSQAGAYAVAVSLLSANKLIGVKLTDNSFINSSGATPTLKAFSSNANTQVLQVSNNLFHGITTRWDYSGVADVNLIDQPEAMDITVASGTGLDVQSPGATRRFTYKIKINKEAWVAAAATQDITILQCPIKTNVVTMVVDTNQAYANLAGTISLMVGYGSGGAQYIADHDVKTAAVTKGIADADLGTAMVRSAAVQGGVFPSWAGNINIVARLTSGTGNIGNGTTTNLTAGTTFIYITVEIMQ